MDKVMFIFPKDGLYKFIKRIKDTYNLFKKLMSCKIYLRFSN